MTTEFVLEENVQVCDYCGSKYDETCEGHQHNEDCECKHCESQDVRLMGYGFCSPECEMHWAWEGLYKTKERQYCTRIDNGRISG